MVPIEQIGLGDIGATQPIPRADQAFLDYANERGWNVGAEWSPEHDDEDDGHVYPACWYVTLYRMGPCGNDDHCYCALDVTENAYARGHEDYWRALIDLADGEWERIRARARASSNGVVE